MIFNLVFAKNTILLFFLFFLLIIDLYFLLPTVIAKLFNHIAEFAVLIGIPSKDTKVEIEIHSVTAETKIRKCLI